MSTPEPMMMRVAEATALGQVGDPDQGRSALAALWDGLGPSGDPVHCCAVAHALADL